MKRYTTAELRQAVREGARISRARWEDAAAYDRELRQAAVRKYAPIELPPDEKMEVQTLSDWLQDNK